MSRATRILAIADGRDAWTKIQRLRAGFAGMDVTYLWTGSKPGERPGAKEYAALAQGPEAERRLRSLVPTRPVSRVGRWVRGIRLFLTVVAARADVIVSAPSAGAALRIGWLFGARTIVIDTEDRSGTGLIPLPAPAPYAELRVPVPGARRVTSRPL